VPLLEVVRDGGYSSEGSESVYVSADISNHKLSGPCTVSSSSLGSPFPPPSCLCPGFLTLGFSISDFLLAVISSGSTSDSLLSAVIVLFVRRGAVV